MLKLLLTTDCIAVFILLNSLLTPSTFTTLELSTKANAISLIRPQPNYTKIKCNCYMFFQSDIKLNKNKAI